MPPISERQRVAVRLSDVSLLEGRADRIRAGGCIAGTDRDLFCGAVAVTVMVNAVADIAGNTLDVSLIAMVSLVCIQRIKKTHSLFRLSVF